MLKLLNYFAITFLVTEELLKKTINNKNVSYLNQNSKTKYLLKIKTTKCSLTA